MAQNGSGGFLEGLMTLVPKEISGLRQLSSGAIPPPLPLRATSGGTAGGSSYSL